MQEMRAFWQLFPGTKNCAGDIWLEVKSRHTLFKKRESTPQNESRLMNWGKIPKSLGVWDLRTMTLFRSFAYSSQDSYICTSLSFLVLFITWSVSKEALPIFPLKLVWKCSFYSMKFGKSVQASDNLFYTLILMSLVSILLSPIP